MRQSPKLGFSLIELSIVILIIGILVIGITKGSRIVSEARLKSARSLTASSPVASIPNLTFWIEATSQSSFDDSERVNTAIGATGTITNWYDINPQSTEKNSPTQGTSGNKPRYIANAINGLPAVNFDGSNDKMAFSGYNLGINGKDWTIYAVTQPRVSGTTRYFSGDNNLSYSMGYSVDSFIFCGASDCFSSSGVLNSYSAPKPTILGVSYKPWETFRYSFYLFGRRSGTYNNSTNLTAPLNVVSMSIGHSIPFNHYFNGDIAEIIIFSRALKDSEHTTIQDYLKNKWGVK